jgi:hypothetical protein
MRNGPAQPAKPLQSSERMNLKSLIYGLTKWQLAMALARLIAIISREGGLASRL